MKKQETRDGLPLRIQASVRRVFQEMHPTTQLGVQKELRYAVYFFNKLSELANRQKNTVHETMASKALKIINTSEISAIINTDISVEVFTLDEQSVIKDSVERIIQPLLSENNEVDVDAVTNLERLGIEGIFQVSAEELENPYCIEERFLEEYGDYID